MDNLRRLEETNRLSSRPNSYQFKIEDGKPGLNIGPNRFTHMRKNNDQTSRRATCAVGFLAVIICGMSFGCTTKGDLERTGSSLTRLRSPSTGMEFALIPAGTFEMSSPSNEPERKKTEMQHRVTLTRRFYMGVCEATQEQFAHVMGFNPSTVKGSLRLPVETVSWFDAILFCNRLSEKDRLPAAYEISNIKKNGDHVVGAEVSQILSSTGYRLPTRSEERRVGKECRSRW